MTRPAKNIAASVRQRLLDESKRRGADFDAILVRFAGERILSRLSRSSYAGRFVLKGAMLFAIWGGNTHRPTRDMDLLGFGSSDADEIAGVFRELLKMDAENDGLVFNPASLSVGSIRALDGYGGLVVKFVASLDRARIGVRIDIGFGDVITPEPDTVSFPNLLPDFDAPKIRAYPVYTVFAEKFEATIRLGDGNGRMKDFFDLWYLTEKFTLEPAQLRTAIAATFERRGTALPSSADLRPFTPEFAALKGKSWKQFLDRNRLPEPAGSFAALLAHLRSYLIVTGRGIMPSPA
jgi:hypothetical protein